jgi:glycosyltransferase involved in cell wall biosynthesis
VDGVCGFLVDGRDPESFADCCLRLIRDRELREKMGRAAKERVVRYFSFHRMTLDYRNLYFRIV